MQVQNQKDSLNRIMKKKNKVIYPQTVDKKTTELKNKCISKYKHTRNTVAYVLPLHKLSPSPTTINDSKFHNRYPATIKHLKESSISNNSYRVSPEKVHHLEKVSLTDDPT